MSAPDTIREATCTRCGARIDLATSRCVGCGASPSEPPPATRQPLPPSTVTTPSQRKAMLWIAVVPLVLATIGAVAAFCGRSAPPPRDHGAHRSR